jgi:hypothetical protein
MQRQINAGGSLEQFGSNYGPGPMVNDLSAWLPSGPRMDDTGCSEDASRYMKQGLLQ